MKNLKRYLSTLLVVCMVISIFPTSVFATGREYCYDSENIVGSCRLTAQAKTDGALSNETGGTVERDDNAEFFECGGGVWTFRAKANPGYKFVGWDTSLSWDRWHIVIGKDHWDSKTEINPEKIYNNLIDDHVDNRNGNNAFHEDKTHMAIHHVGCSAQSVGFIRNVHYNIIAKFERIPNPIHNVKFDKNSKDANEPSYDSVKIEKGKSFADMNKAFPTCTRDGYRLEGWYTNKKCTAGNEFLVTTPIHNAMTVYAKWSVTNKTYGVYHYSPYAVVGSYDTDFSNNAFTNSVITDAYINGLKNKLKYGEYEGYDLWGYKPNDSTKYKIATKDDAATIKSEYDVSEYRYLAIHLCYKEDAVTHTVAFDSNGGSNVSTITKIRVNNKIQPPTPPTKTDYKFIGWYKDSALETAWDFAADTVNSDITLYAKWSVANKTYGVYHYSPYSAVGSYDTDFSNNAFTNSVITDAYINGLKNKLKYGEYEGYDLWGYKPNDSTKYKIATKDDAATIKSEYDVSEYRYLAIHLCYKEDAVTHTVTFNSNGGSNVSTITKIRVNNKIASPVIPTKNDCIFVGWFKDLALETAWDFATDRVNGNITLYAKWIKDLSKFTNYTVEYYKDSITDGNKLYTATEKEIKLGLTVTLTDEEKNLKQPTDYLAGVVSGAAITTSNRVVKVLYTRNNALFTDYTVEYYHDSITPENIIGEPVQKDEIRLGSTVTLSEYEKNLKQPADYLEGVVSGATITTSNRVVKVLYTRNNLIFTNYTVEYYHDSITPENIIGEPVQKDEIRLGSTVTLSEYEKNLKQPADYLEGVVSGAAITTSNKVVKVLYIRNNSIFTNYTIEYYHDSIAPENIIGEPIQKGEIKLGSIVTLSEEEINARIQEGYINAVVSGATITKDNKVVKVVYTKADIIKVTHNYFLNGTLNTSLFNNQVVPADKTNIQTSIWQKLIDGYSFSGITIKGILKDLFAKSISEVQVQINELNDQLKTLQDKLALEKAKAPTEEVKAPTEEVKAPTEEVKAPTEEVKAPAGEAKAPTEEVKAPTEGVKAPTKEVNSVISDIEKQINGIELQIKELQALLVEKEINSTDTNFVYDARYNYSVTINYSKTVSTDNGNTNNPGNNNSGNTNTGGTIDIPDPEVPLAKLPDDIVTIVDETVPLGKLAKSGGLQAASVGASALIALLLSVLLKLKRKED